MYAVEFETQITNGHIVVPEAFRNQLFGSVRVLMLVENGFASTMDESEAFVRMNENKRTDEARRPGESLLAYRLRNPYRVNNFQPLTREEIYER